MLQLTPQSRIFVATEPVDFRKGIDGLAAVCRQRLGANPLEGAVYVNPSVAAEGFQLTQLEALLAGAAVVGYDVGVARELEASAVGDVVVVPRGGRAALAEAALAAVGRPPSPPTRDQVLRWDWGTVADDYAALLTSTGPR